MLQRQISRPKLRRFRLSWTQRAQAPTEPLPRRPDCHSTSAFRHPRVLSEHDCLPGPGASKGVWGPRGEQAGDRAPKGTSLVAAVCAHPGKPALPGWVPPTHLPQPSGAAAEWGLLGDAPYGHGSPCSYLGLLGPPSRFSSVTAENWANRARHWGGEAPRG